MKRGDVPWTGEREDAAVLVPPGYLFDADAEAKTKAFRAAAALLRGMAGKLAADVAPLLDDSANVCSGCGTASYRNFTQRQMRVRVMGAQERLLEIADTLERRSRDPDFLGLPLPGLSGGDSCAKS